mmetsp:Transcript_4305/g.9696  ORF Transcript_4305/g.9696 Transcript_4305/m.9696 type:complete len:83 (+) Transcript_4305:600-848(+)
MQRKCQYDSSPKQCLFSRLSQTIFRTFHRSIERERRNEVDNKNSPFPSRTGNQSEKKLTKPSVSQGLSMVCDDPSELVFVLY